MLIVISLIIALIVAGIATGGMRSELKSVNFKDSASSYKKEDSLKITGRNEKYLYKNTSSSPKSKK